MVTAKSAAPHRIRGLESGVDDYMAKPFEPKELVLRIEAILRRVDSTPAEIRQVKLGRCVFDSSRGVLTARSNTRRATK